MASIRLNHLHVSFLLRRLGWDRLSEPNAPLIEVAIEMLKLVVELVMLREELSNSGINLSWKVCVQRPPLGSSKLVNNADLCRLLTMGYLPLASYCWPCLTPTRLRPVSGRHGAAFSRILRSGPWRLRKVQWRKRETPTTPYLPKPHKQFICFWLLL